MVSFFPSAYLFSILLETEHRNLFFLEKDNIIVRIGHFDTSKIVSVPTLYHLFDHVLSIIWVSRLHHDQGMSLHVSEETTQLQWWKAKPPCSWNGSVSNLVFLTIHSRSAGTYYDSPLLTINIFGITLTLLFPNVTADFSAKKALWLTLSDDHNVSYVRIIRMIVIFEKEEMEGF